MAEEELEVAEVVVLVVDSVAVEEAVVEVIEEEEVEAAVVEEVHRSLPSLKLHSAKGNLKCSD